MKFSVIIPTLNEEYSIGKCIENVQHTLPGAEIIVSDGFSADQTVKIALSYNIIVIQDSKNRGAQLNSGAKKATGEVLLFLHADTILPENAYELVEEYFYHPLTKIATFSLSFDVDFPYLKFYSKFSKYDSLFTKFGDNCIVVARKFFDEVGPFPDWPIFEDVLFLRKARKFTPVHTFPAPVITSARRFLRNGLIKTQLRNFSYIMLYLLGFSPRYLYKRYNKMKHYNDQAVIIFSKYPVEGKVKTRIAKTLGNNFAVKFYKMCAEHTFRQVKKVTGKNIRTYLFYTEEAEKEKIKTWTNHKFLLMLQRGNSLGEKMLNAFRNVFEHGAIKVLIIGTDLPDISAKIINDALEDLENFDTVIGPSSDGGYYLLGMKEFYPEIFKDINWSTSEVFEKTLEQITNLDIAVKILPELSDIDTEEDLKEWLAIQSSSNKSAVRKEIKSFYMSYKES